MSHSAETHGLSKDHNGPEASGAHPGSAPSNDVDWVWDQFAELLDLVEVLAGEAVTPEQFYDRILSELVSGFAAEGGRVWLVDSQRPRLLCQSGPTLIEDDRGKHEEILTSSLDNFDAKTHEVGNKTISVVAVPTSNEKKSSAALIEITQRNNAPQEVYETTARLLEAVAGIAMLFHMRMASDRINSKVAIQSKLIDLAQRVAGDMRTGPTAYRIVNESRQVLEVDRVSLFDARGRVPRLLATSQVEKVDQHSKTVAQLKQFAKLAAHSKRSLHWSVDAAISAQHAFPEEFQEQLDHYSDENHVRSMILAPMFAPSEVLENEADDTDPRNLIGILIAESFRISEKPHQINDLVMVAQVCSPALDAAFKTPLSSLQSSLSWWTKPSRLLISALLACVLAIALMLACVVQIEHTVTLRGQVVPIRQMELYAPADSQVIQIHVESGQSVEIGEVLIELQDSHSLLELQRLQGELALYERQLDAIAASRLSLDRNVTTTDEKLRLTSEQERLRLEVKSTKAMIKLVEKERDLLTVRSPIDGNVSTWQVNQLLENRPVQRGQQLLSVVDQKAGWKIELEAPDDRLGILRDAEQITQEDLKVEYQIASQPDEIFHGSLTQISSVIEQPEDDFGRPFARIEVEAKDLGEIASDSDTPLVGVSVTAEVQCGKKSFAEVALYDVWRFLKTKWELGW